MDEFVVGRKTAGVLVAVTPCLQIVAIAPMWASESIPQVLLFLLSVMELFPTLAFAIYDNACAVVRHMRKKLRVAPPSAEGGSVSCSGSSIVCITLTIRVAVTWRAPSSCRETMLTATPH